MTGGKWAVTSLVIVGISLLAYDLLIGRMPVRSFPALTCLATLASIAGFGTALKATRAARPGEGKRLAMLSLVMATGFLIVMGILIFNVGVKWALL